MPLYTSRIRTGNRMTPFWRTGTPNGSGSTVPDPSSIADLLAWWNPVGIQGANGANIITTTNPWLDSGPNNYTMRSISNTAGDQPLVTTLSLNGYTVAGAPGSSGDSTYRALAVDGTSPASAFNGVSSAATWTVFATVNWATTGTTRNDFMSFLGDGTNNGFRLGLVNAGNIQLTYPNVGNFNGPTPLLNVWHTLILVSSSNAITLYVDNDGGTSLGTHSMSGPDTRLFWMGAQPGGASIAFHGKMSDLAVYNRALTSAERATLFAYTRGKYLI